MGFFFASLLERQPYAINIIADGDSVTAGEKAPSYVTFYKAYLESRMPHLTVNISNVAVSGQSLGQMLSDASAQIISQNPDVITLSVGLNDSYGDSSSYFASSLETYVQLVLGHTNPVTGICPQLVLITDNLASENLDKFYARTYANQKITRDAVVQVVNAHAGNPNIYFANVFDAFDALVIESAEFLSKLDPTDKLHPVTSGYVIYSDVINPILKMACDRVKLYI